MGIFLSTMQLSCKNEQKKCVPFQIQQGLASMPPEGTPEYAQMEKAMDKKLEDFYGMTQDELKSKFPTPGQEKSNDLSLLMTIPDVSKLMSPEQINFTNQRCNEKYPGSTADIRLCCDQALKNNYGEGEGIMGSGSPIFKLENGKVVINEANTTPAMDNINLINPTTFASCGQDHIDQIKTACGNKAPDRGACALDFCSQKGYTKPADLFDTCQSLGGQPCLDYPSCDLGGLSSPAPAPLQTGLSAPSPAPASLQTGLSAPSPAPVDDEIQQQIQQQILASQPIVPPESDKKDQTMLWVGLGVGTIFVIILIVIIILIATKKKPV